MTVEPRRELSRKVSIVGVGDTDYGADYRAARAGGPDTEFPDVVDQARTAFTRAVADAGLRPDDVDGFLVATGTGDNTPDDMAKALGIKGSLVAAAPSVMMAGVIPEGVAALMNGTCDTIALLFATTARTTRREFGGEGVDRGPSSYYYFHTWGWSSQAAHWALMFSYYQSQFGATERDLGEVAITIRNHAMRNDNAIMRDPLTIEQYLESRYVVRPLHLLDMCLVNDGSVCLILRRSDESTDLAHTPVAVAGWGESHVTESKFHYMVKERLRPQLQEAARQAFDMAGLTPADVDHFQGYDASTFHLIDQLEGYGFAPVGEGLAFCKDGHMSLGGSLPTNTNGGLLSESYMIGWNHVVEVVRQLRHEGGHRQVEGARTSLFSLATTDSAYPVIMTREA